jgi:hypothetical protein
LDELASLAELHTEQHVDEKQHISKRQKAKKAKPMRKIVTFMTCPPLDFESVVRVVGPHDNSSESPVRYDIVEMKSTQVWARETFRNDENEQDKRVHVRTISGATLRPVDDRIIKEPKGVGQVAMCALSVVFKTLAKLDPFATLIPSDHWLWNAIPGYDWWMSKKAMKLADLTKHAMEFFIENREMLQVATLPRQPTDSSGTFLNCLTTCSSHESHLLLQTMCQLTAALKHALCLPLRQTILQSLI